MVFEHSPSFLLEDHHPSFLEYQHDRTLSRESEALRILRKVASAVEPLMLQRGWKVDILGEFYPREVGLGGMIWNQDEKMIYLRLRQPSDESRFLPLDEITDALLHQLCHLVRVLHDETFYQLWYQLRDELDAFIRKGYTDEDFVFTDKELNGKRSTEENIISTGNKLGGESVPLHEVLRARIAAEQRRKAEARASHRFKGGLVQRGHDATERITQGCSSSGIISKVRETELVQATNRKGSRSKAETRDLYTIIAYMTLVSSHPVNEAVLASASSPSDYGENLLPRTPYEFASEPVPASSTQAPRRNLLPIRGPIRGPPPRSPARGLLRHSADQARPSSSRPQGTDRHVHFEGIAPSTRPAQSSSSARPIRQPSPATPRPQANRSLSREGATPSPRGILSGCARPLGTHPPPSSPSQGSSNQSPKGTLPPTTRLHPTSVKDSNAKKAAKSLLSLDATTPQKSKNPPKWKCLCENSMENEGWVCAVCESVINSS